MKLFDQLRDTIINLDEQTFYKYSGIALGALVVITSLILFSYQRSVSTLIDTITTLNEERERTRVILTRAERVKRQRAEVDAIIKEDESFKIGGFFNDVLNSLNLTDKKMHGEETSQVEKEDKYTESILRAKLTDMTMKDICELLNTLDQNKRIYIKELDIVTLKKIPPALEVTITIASLEPKTSPKE
jgi:hypothetical protein